MSSSIGTVVAVVATTKRPRDVERRRTASLTILDRHLTNANFKSALSFVKHLHRQSLLPGFSAAPHVPRRVSSVEQLHLSVTETSVLQSLLDAILDSVNTSLQSSPLDESSVTNEDNELYVEDDIIQHKQVVQHEAGHFLVGYLLGVLPKQYTLSSTDDKIANASVKFVGFEFLKELDDIVLSNETMLEIKPGHQANKLKVSSMVCEGFCHKYSSISSFPIAY